jgi:hypothetical protein
MLFKRSMQSCMLLCAPLLLLFKLLMLLATATDHYINSFVDDGFKVPKEHMPLLAADGQVRGSSYGTIKV